MLDTIQSISHKVSTAYGNYNRTYSGKTIPDKFRYVMMGLFQGKGCAPQLWWIISFIFLSALCTQGFGVHFVNSFTAKIAQLVGFSYVYECGVIQLDDDIKSTHSKMQIAISEWAMYMNVAWSNYMTTSNPPTQKCRLQYQNGKT